MKLRHGIAGQDLNQAVFHGSRSDFLGVPLAPCTTGQFISAVTQAAGPNPETGTGADASPASSPVFITYLNAACSNLAARDSEYFEILRQADCIYADGQAIVWASRWLGCPVPERVNAGDFILDFCQEAAASNTTLYLVGSAPGIAAAAARRFGTEAAGLQILGADPGYFQDGGEGLVSRIALASPDILIIGMGVPLQEKWAWVNRHRLNVRVVWCVGALFEYYGQTRARAPHWMRSMGMEWAFRLALEPRRLWKRYLVGNAVFLGRVLWSRCCPNSGLWNKNLD